MATINTVGAVHIFGSGGGTVVLPTHADGNDILLFAETIVGNGLSGLGTWTQLTGSPVDQQSGTAVTSARLHAYRIRRSGTAVPDPTIAPTDDGVGANHVVVVAISISDPPDPSAYETVGTSGNGSSISLDGIADLAAGTLAIAAVASTRDANSTTQFDPWANASLDSIAEIVDQTTNQAGGGGLGIAHGTRTAAGTITATTVTAATAEDWAGMLVAIQGTETADHLEFDEQPIATTVDAVITPAVTVRALGAGGGLDTTFTDNVTIAIGTNPGTGVLGGTLTVAAVAGVATFNDLTIDEVGVGYDLDATAAGLTGATSDSFDILAQTATYVEFVVQPSNVVEGVAIAPSITVEANLPDTTRDTSYVGDITLSIGTNPSGGAISGTVTQTAVAGLATFNDIEISVPGTAYTLLATAPGLTQDESDAFNVTLEAATHLFIFVEPSATQTGAAISPSVVVRARNSENVIDTNYAGTVTVAKLSGPGTLGGTLSQVAVNGVATFPDLTLDTAGTYQLRFTDAVTPLTQDDSGAFEVTDSPPPSAAAGGYFRMSGVLGMRL